MPQSWILDEVKVVVFLAPHKYTTEEHAFKIYSQVYNNKSLHFSKPGWHGSFGNASRRYLSIFSQNTQKQVMKKQNLLDTCWVICLGE